ncbi:MAG: CNNM domain-containing protein [Campylobacterota bacterium]|nr:CNNM domain-containing protein [Campylobacterota bacterium]
MSNIFFIAIGVSFLCSILESVLLSLTPAYIEVVKEKNPKTGKLLEKQKDDIDKSIGAILTLNTFAHTLGAAGVGAQAALIFGHEYMFYISAVLTILILIFSESIPKTIGAYYWKELSRISARIIQFLVFTTYPLLVFMKSITNLITANKSILNKITKEEIEATIAMGEDAGVLKEKDSNIIENIFELDTIKVKDIHTPRSVLFTITKKELLNNLKKGSDLTIDMAKMREYSRIPICGDSIDDIKGVVFAKEFFYEYINNEPINKKDIIKPIFEINENIPVSKLLDLFLSKKEHMFLVIDNYGQTQGVVTLEDALETILGTEIVDELDNNIDMRELAKNRKTSHQKSNNY